MLIIQKALSSDLSSNPGTSTDVIVNMQLIILITYCSKRNIYTFALHLKNICISICSISICRGGSVKWTYLHIFFHTPRYGLMTRTLFLNEWLLILHHNLYICYAVINKMLYVDNVKYFNSRFRLFYSLNFEHMS